MKNWIIKIGSLFLLLSTKSIVFAQVSDTILVDQLINKAELANSNEEAILNYEAAYAQARQLNYAQGIEKSLFALAELESKQDNIPGALRYYLETINVLQKNDPNRKIIEVGTAVGDIYSREKLYSESLSYYQLAEQNLNTESSTYIKKATSLFQKLGQAFSELGQPDSAFIYFSKILDFQKEGQRNAYLNTLHSIVNAYLKAGDYQKALPYNLEIEKAIENEGKSDKERVIIYNNLGYNYNFLKQYEQAITYFNKAVELSSEEEYKSLSVLHKNIGVANFNIGKLEKSILSLLKARSLLKKGNEEEKSHINHLLANVYLKSNDYYNAQNFNQIAIEKAENEQLTELLKEAYYTAAQIHSDLFEYEKALEYYQKHLNLRDSLLLNDRLRQQQLLQERLNLERTEKEIRLLLINQELSDLAIQQLETESERKQLALDNLQLESEQKEKELSILKKDQEIKETRLVNQELEAKQTKQQLQLARQLLISEQKDRELADLTQREQIQKLELEQQQSRLQQEEQKSELLRKDNELKQVALDRQQELRKYAMGIVGLLFLLMAMGFVGWWYSRKKNRQLAQKNIEIEAQKEEISTERNKSDQLLLNILPAATAAELKEKGSATPKKYENATVLFADFVSFTKISASLPPEELVEELNSCFHKFDTIVEKHGLEKIKTIGDAYMCVGGLPNPNNSHPRDAIAAALEMMDFINQRYLEKQALNQPYWQMRIGIHSGPVVAGVVGWKKFVYDIWGDTVNTASRMESNSVPGKINLSGATFQLVQDGVPCHYRGKLEAKNKGKVDMYFVEN